MRFEISPMVRLLRAAAEITSDLLYTAVTTDDFRFMPTL